MVKRVFLGSIVFALLASTAAAQQPSPEQLRVFQNLPAAEQQRILDQLGQRGSIPPASINETESRPRPAASMPDPGRAGDDVIDPADTLIIEISGSAPAALLGQRVVVVDSDGAIRLPVLDTVFLAGLDESTASARMNAIPSLTGAVVKVRILPLRPTGRAALKPFGYDVFRQPAGTFAPTAAIPVPTSYTLGPGDIVNVQLFGNESASYGLEVTREGHLMFPAIGPIAVGGLGFGEARETIIRRIREQIIGVQASVTMGPLRSIRIFVLGDVARPGAYTVSALTTATHALFSANGVRESGTLRAVSVRRSGKTIATLDLYDLLLDGDTGDDLRLQDGDVVFVPPAGPQVAIDGAVRRPAIYEFKGAATIEKLVELAGGLDTDAYARVTRVERMDSVTGERGLRSLDLTDPADRKFELNPGDYVSIASMLERIEGMVRLTGHVRRMLAVEHRDGMRVSDLVGSVERLGERPDLDYALLRRESGPTRQVTTVSVELGKALAARGGAADPVLAPNDELIVFGTLQSDERRARVERIVETIRLQASSDLPAKFVTVTGHVRAPGRYPLEDDMRVADLIRAGGGFAESASTSEAEISRVVIDAQDEFSMIHFPTDLGDPTAMELALKSRDTLTVKPKPYWADERTVTLRGQVRFPGTYTVRRNERLSQVIERAGGLTPDAFPGGAVFMRESLRQKEQEQIDLMADRLRIDVATARLGENETMQQQFAAAQALAAQLRNTRAAGRLVIDLPRALANSGDAELDIDVRDGDVLVVPSKPQEVTIIGEVHYSTSHFWDRGRSLEDYIDLSGGGTNRADLKRIYLVRANGAVEPARNGGFGRSRAAVRPGDTIIVPLDTDRVPNLVLWTNVSQIVYQIGIAAAAWKSVGGF